MTKRKIAVLFGGHSPEYNISLSSAYGVLSHLDKERFQPYPIGISKEGKWFYFRGSLKKIKEDTWENKEDSIPCIFPQERGNNQVYLQDGATFSSFSIDGVFPILHGKNGEDGSVQGLFALSDLPLVGCDVFSSSLCMDKYLTHQICKGEGILVPSSVFIQKESFSSSSLDPVLPFSYPLYVKPARAGSSFGISKISKKEELKDAVLRAFLYDDKVVLEECIQGFEVGCAILGTKNLTLGEVDEIQVSHGFFDHDKKYMQKDSQIYVPARIPEEKRKEIQSLSQKIYRILGCKGLARIDLFLTTHGDLFLNEVNTMPGLTPVSRFPSMFQAAGISFSEMLTQLILSELEE